MIFHMEIDQGLRFNTLLEKLNQRDCRIKSHRLVLFRLLAGFPCPKFLDGTQPLNSQHLPPSGWG
jgi:hypothetical protein